MSQNKRMGRPNGLNLACTFHAATIFMQTYCILMRI